MAFIRPASRSRSAPWQRTRACGRAGNDTGNVGHATSLSPVTSFVRSGQRPQTDFSSRQQKPARPLERPPAAYCGARTPAPPAAVASTANAVTPLPLPVRSGAAAATTAPTEIRWRRNSVLNRPSVRPSVRVHTSVAGRGLAFQSAPSPLAPSRRACFLTPSVSVSAV